MKLSVLKQLIKEEFLREIKVDTRRAKLVKVGNNWELAVGDYITMLSHYQQKLIQAWTLSPGNDQALDVMRKIAGIAVHCMEDHGSVKREVNV